MSKIDYCEYSINNYINNAVFTGETADAIKSYLTDVHITMLSSLRVTAQNLLDNMSLYKAGYYDIDNSTNFKLSEEIIQAFRTTLSTNYSYTQSNTKKIQEAVSGISDISEVSTPSSNGVLELHEQIDQELSNFITSIQNYETDTVTALENSVDLLISSLNSCNEKIGLNKGAIASYTSNSFYTDKDAYALAYISELFYQHHEENKELYDKIVETEQGLKEAAEEREIQGIWEVVGGVGLLVAGGLCIYFTAGAAAPLVADIGFSIGLGTTIFGVADSEEGIQDICYGKAGDISSTAVNNLKDVVFQENEEAYYLAENIISFAASAMIPIGQASVVGKLTFRSGATIVAKEGISTVAGVGAEKVTTYYTENQTLGMFAGMIASGTTSKGLDKLDTKFNISGNVKVSGVGESGLNSVDDIIKGVENGDVPLSNNIQKGNYGEMKMDAYFESQGYERISIDRVTDLNTPTHQGIDGVYYNPDGHPPYIIGEAKYGSSRLSTLADGTPQMSDKWIIDRLENAVGEEVANDIKMEMILNPDNVGSLLVHVSPDGGIDITELIDGIKQ